MKYEDYPALFLDADNSSNKYQARFTKLIFFEYATLFLAAVFSLSFLSGVVFNFFYAATFFIGLILLIARSQGESEQNWYGCRAFAESIKTLTWRFIMRATPFDGDSSMAHAEFRSQLQGIFKQNIDTARLFSEDFSAADQITAVMSEIREKPTEERLTYYIEFRVKEQRQWYRRKAAHNRSSASFWTWLGGFCYVAAGSMVLGRLAWPDFQFWPIEPLIVLAASIIGWKQTKKFNELATAYTVTAHEIGLINSPDYGAHDESHLSTFVNDAEKAFSREHTLWVARQSD